VFRHSHLWSCDDDSASVPGDWCWVLLALTANRFWSCDDDSSSVSALCCDRTFPKSFSSLHLSKSWRNPIVDWMFATRIMRGNPDSLMSVVAQSLFESTTRILQQN
jgi:hypothetical protein